MQGCPSRVWTRSPSCIDPCSPRASRKSSIEAPPPAIPASSAATIPAWSASWCSGRIEPAGESGVVPLGTAPRRRRCCRPPRPATWWRGKDLSGAVRPVASSPSTSGVNSAESGSTPRRSNRSPAWVIDQERLAEPARIGEPELAPVVERRSGRGGGARRRALRLIQAHPLRWVELGAPSTRTRLPVIRRCMTRVAPSSSASSRYLPRRPSASIPVPTTSPPARRAAPAAPARIEHLEPLDPVPFDLRLELAADGLDLGKLGHRPVLPCVGLRRL